MSKANTSDCMTVGYAGHALVHGATRKAGTALAVMAKSGWFCLTFVGADGRKRQRRVPSTLEFTVAGLLNALGGAQ